MASVAPLCPYHDNHAAPQAPDSNDPLFTVVETVIDHIECVAFENCCGVFKGESAVLERRITLGSIKGYSHYLLYPQKMKSANVFLYPQQC
ncbi:hypothetical protein B0G57_110147 [Trinickia symbiotica]|nr:hypothetical protein B0G57_110147 [Trinickia symbiotica]